MSKLCCIAALLLAVTAQAKVNIVASLPDLGAVAREIGGDNVAVEVLASAEQDPHFVDARPNLLVPLSHADLLIVNGLELEAAWLRPLIVNSRNGKIQIGGPGYLDASLTVQKLEVPSGAIDRAKGDVHPGGNPHYMYAPGPAVAVAAAIRDTLNRLDAAHKADYDAACARLTATLQTLDKQQRDRFAVLDAAKRQAVPYHRSLPYLFAWLGLSDPIEVEPRPGIAPDPQHVAAVLNLMKTQRIRVVVQEGYYPRNTSETLGRLAGGEVVVIDSGADFAGGQKYADHLKKNADALYTALSR